MATGWSSGGSFRIACLTTALIMGGMSAKIFLRTCFKPNLATALAAFFARSRPVLATLLITFPSPPSHCSKCGSSSPDGR